jgi:NAD(P)H-hydrate epimerase
MPIPEIAIADAPVVTRAQMLEIDRVMVEELGILLIQMMENVGRALAALAEDLVSAHPARIAVLAGRGNNGGGALTGGRRLAARGHAVSVFITTPRDTFEGIPRQQLDICAALSVPIADRLPEEPDAFGLILDGVIGYSLTGAPRGAAADAIDWINARRAATCVSLDVPSGFDAAAGQPSERMARADAILTLAALKTGLAEAAGGIPIYLADISVPAALLQSSAGRAVPSHRDLVRVV